MQSRSPQPGDTTCSYDHTHPHKRLTHTYHPAIRYILSSTQLCASKLFKYKPISIKVALGIVLWSLKAIVWWSLKQSIALYSVFQWPNPKATFIEIGVYLSLPSYVLISRKSAKWTSRFEPELSIDVMVLYKYLFPRKIVENERYRRPSWPGLAF